MTRIYAVWNHSKKEIYIGVSDDYKNRWKEHRQGKCGTTKQWFADDDDIDFKLIPNSGYSSRSDASEFAHWIERQANADNYTIIETNGI